MTVITINALETLLGGAAAAAKAYVTVEYKQSGGRPAVVVDGADVTLARTVRVEIRDGVPVLTLDVDPTVTDVTYAKLTVRSYASGTPQLVWNVTIPESGTHDIGDLTQVDPDSFEPVAAGSTVAQQLALKANTADLGTAAAADTDAFATAEQGEKADSAYQLPEDGVPGSDLTEAVRTSLGKADSAYQKPADGVPGSDLTEAVRTSLGKADGAAQKDQNLNDVVDKAAARTNLDVFSKAEANAAIAERTGITVSIADYASLKAAITAAGAGGTVLVPLGAFPAGDWTYDTDYMNTPNVRILGVQMPRLSANADRLEGGSVIYGRFNAFADGLNVHDVGFDMGKHVIDTYYGGVDTHTANHPLGGTWDAFAFAQPNIGSPLPNRRGVSIRNVIGLVRDSQSVAHAVLIEGITTGDAHNITGIGGIHGVVVKSKHMTLGDIRGWAASIENVIIKSEVYAPAGHLTIRSVESLTEIPGVTPWFTPAVAANGLMFNPVADFVGPVQIDSLKVFGADRGIAFYGAGIVDEVWVGNVKLNGYTGNMTIGVIRATARALRVSFGSLSVSSSTVGIDWSASAAYAADSELRVGDATFTNIGVRVVQATDNGRVNFTGSVRSVASNAMFYVGDNARVAAGSQRLISTSPAWERTPPSLETGWTDFGSGNSPFEVYLVAGMVAVKGLVLAGSGATGTIGHIPPYLRPAAGMRFPAYRNSAGERLPAMIGIGAGGEITLDDGTPPLAGDYVSLDGIHWPTT